MTTIATRGGTELVKAGPLVERRRWGTLAMKLLTTTDHKVIGNMYFVTSLAYFSFAGLLALAIRAELAFLGLQFLHYDTYNQFFTMHGTLMLLMFATPLFAAFANAIMPLQIGAPDVAFPRMNAFSYWMYLFGSLTATSGFLTPVALRASGGSLTFRFRTRLTRRASAVTCR